MQNLDTKAFRDACAVIDAAIVAGAAAARAQYEKEGSADFGQCGGAMLILDKRSTIARAAIERKAAYTGTGEVTALLQLPDGVRTQSRNVKEAQYFAFRDHLVAAGFGKAIRRFWTYAD